MPAACGLTWVSGSGGGAGMRKFFVRRGVMAASKEEKEERATKAASAGVVKREQSPKRGHESAPMESKPSPEAKLTRGHESTKDTTAISTRSQRKDRINRAVGGWIFGPNTGERSRTGASGHSLRASFNPGNRERRPPLRPLPTAFATGQRNAVSCSLG